jgi:hypothetical protein
MLYAGVRLPVLKFSNALGDCFQGETGWFLLSIPDDLLGREEH